MVEGYGITVLPEIAVRREMHVGLLIGVLLIIKKARLAAGF